MSRSRYVDEKYRLHHADFEGRARRVLVSNISYQGLEEVRAVLHFEGLSKRLVLDPASCHDLIRMTGSVQLADWVGQTIQVRPLAGEEGARLEIQAVEAETSPTTWLAPDDESERSGWIVSLVVVTLLLAASAYYADLNAEAIVAALEALLP